MFLRWHPINSVRTEGDVRDVETKALLATIRFELFDVNEGHLWVVDIATSDGSFRRVAQGKSRTASGDAIAAVEEFFGGKLE